jgi:hypothetical protein
MEAEDELRIRDALQLGPEIDVVEVARFPASTERLLESEPPLRDEQSPFEEETLATIERDLPDGPRPQALAEESLVELALDDAMAPDPDIGEHLPVSEVSRLEVDVRILLLEGVPDSALGDGSVDEVGPGRWVFDTRGELPAVLYIGDHEAGVALWGKGGEVRIYQVNRRRPRSAR